MSQRNRNITEIYTQKFTAQMCFSEFGRAFLVYPCTGILLSKRNEWTIYIHITWMSLKGRVKVLWQKIICYTLLFMLHYEKDRTVRIENRSVAVRSLRIKRKDVLQNYSTSKFCGQAMSMSWWLWYIESTCVKTHRTVQSQKVNFIAC